MGNPLKYPEFNPAEIEALERAGFSESELTEINMMKAGLKGAESNLQRAVIVATMGLNYFLGTSFKPEVIPVEIADGVPGYQIKAYEPEGDGVFALTAVVTIVGDSDNDTPSSIRYGYILNSEEKNDLIKTIKEVQYDGGLEIFAQLIYFLELTSYSFLVNGEEKERNEVMAGDAINGIIQHPLSDFMGMSGVFATTVL